jgi:hypothetical protein
MPTISQLVRRGRKPLVKKTKAPALVCSRYFNDSHLAVVVFLLILAGLSRRGAVARLSESPVLARAA